MFVSKAKGTLGCDPTLLGSFDTNIRLFCKKVACDKHSSLLQQSGTKRIGCVTWYRLERDPPRRDELEDALDDRLPFSRRFKAFLSSFSASLSPNIRPSFVGRFGVFGKFGVFVGVRNSTVWSSWCQR
jgi:hypothetical protein